MLSVTQLGDIVIPACNEETVIGRCLSALLKGVDGDAVQIIVACNGCTDRTADVARGFGDTIQVLDLPRPSKTAAIRAAEMLCGHRPRLYVDADVELSGSSARALLERLRTSAIAARPPIKYSTDGAAWPVLRYYRARSATASVMGSLWGAGVYGLSEQGRSRFAEFPDVVADDLWVDQHFDPHEIEIVDCDPVIVHTPTTVAGLRRILRRAHRGAAECSKEGAGKGSTVRTLKDLVRVARSGMSETLDVATYVTFAAISRVDVSLVRSSGWERDETSRGSP